jgi:chaperonin GroEL
MSKTIIFSKEAKAKLKSGVDKLNNAVSVTLGPFGRNVLIEKEYGIVTSTKDGVTVAKEIELEDPIENMAATIIKQAAIKTVEAAGDGTTTSTILASHMVSLGFYYNSNNITQVKKGIEFATKEVIERLKEISQDVVDEDQIKKVAKLSANGDDEIAALVTTALDKVGREGIVTVEESKTGETSLEVVEGLQFDRGYKSPYFVTDNNSMQSVLNEPLILIYDKKISQVKELLPILESVSQQNKPILILAEDIEGEALATLIVNKMRGILKVVAVKAPEFGDRRTQVLEDIAILTGGTVVSHEKGMRLDKFDTNWFGNARTITVGKETTTIIDGKGEPDVIKERILNLKEQLDKGSSPYEIEKLQERLAKMVGGVAIINVGGFNDVDIKEKKDRLDDALQATKAAIEEGVLPGAGMSLMHARDILDYQEPKNNADFNIGIRIVYGACQKPFDRILKNAGEDNTTEWLFEATAIVKKDNYKMVPNVGSNKEFINCDTAGILDPTKVVRNALKNASGAAINLLLTECVISNKPEENKQSSTPGMDMSQYGM